MTNRVETTESPRSAAADEESSIASYSSFASARRDERAKALFPFLRSYTCRVKLAKALLAAVLILVGALVSMDMMEEDGHLLGSGEFSEQYRRTMLFVR